MMYDECAEVLAQYDGELFTEDESKELISSMNTRICELCGGPMMMNSSPGLTKHCRVCWKSITKLVKAYREKGMHGTLTQQYKHALAVLKHEWHEYGC